MCLATCNSHVFHCFEILKSSWKACESTEKQEAIAELSSKQT